MSRSTRAKNCIYIIISSVVIGINASDEVNNNELSQDRTFCVDRVIANWVTAQQNEWVHARKNKNAKLERAYRRRKSEIKAAIIKYVIDPNQIRDTKREYTSKYICLLDEAISHNDIEFTRFLLERNAVSNKCFNLIKTKAMAELVLPYMMRHKDFANLFKRYGLYRVCQENNYAPGLIEFYLSHGADITHGTENGNTLLCLLINCHEISHDPNHSIYEKARLLIDAGVPLDNGGDTWHSLIWKKITQKTTAEAIRSAYRHLEEVIWKAIDDKQKRHIVAQQYFAESVTCIPTVLIPIIIAYVAHNAPTAKALQ